MATHRIRLDKCLSNLGYCSRSEVKSLIKQGIILVNNELVKKADIAVDPATVTFDGEPLDPASINIAFHKPVGFVCSHKENEGRLIYELLPERWRFRKPLVSTVGRLDKETSGIIIITDDGQLNHKLTQPSKVGKTYQVVTRDTLSGDEPEIFASGDFKLPDDDTPLLPANLKITGPNSAELIIYEGRYHQVRRMFAALGNEVVKLHRVAIGGLKVDTIPESGWIELTQDMIDSMLALD